MSNESKREEKRFLSWLCDLLATKQFDLVVSVERKATAVLRDLLDLSQDFHCDWNWKQVLSSEALPYLPDNWLEGKSILVFNEMIHRGHSTQDTISKILANTPKDGIKRIETAAFVVHEEFPREGLANTGSSTGRSRCSLARSCCRS